MTTYVSVGQLQVAEVLLSFVRDEALPGSGIDDATFWAGVESIAAEFAPSGYTEPLLHRHRRILKGDEP